MEFLSVDVADDNQKNVTVSYVSWVKCKTLGFLGWHISVRQPVF